MTTLTYYIFEISPNELPAPASDITYNQANQMLTFTPLESSSFLMGFNPSVDTAKSMTYDENGNMTSVTNGCGTTTYTWDARNRLVGIQGYTSTCTSLSASFTYDALGRRIEKTINGNTIQYLYDGLDIVQEIEGGMVSVNYVRTLNIDEPLARIKSDGTIRYYQTDALGSVIALTDETGNVKTTYNYDPFGNVTISGEPSDNPFQYTGRENDETELYYYRARYYSPELQRFISEDPIGLLGGINQFSYVDSFGKPLGETNLYQYVDSVGKPMMEINLYQYNGNNPVNYIDPLGLAVFPIDYYKFSPTGGWPPSGESKECEKDCDWGEFAKCVGRKIAQNKSKIAACSILCRAAYLSKHPGAIAACLICVTGGGYYIWDCYEQTCN